MLLNIIHIKWKKTPLGPIIWYEKKQDTEWEIWDRAEWEQGLLKKDCEILVKALGDHDFEK